jgi:hypothetical protein
MRGSMNANTCSAFDIYGTAQYGAWVRTRITWVSDTLDTWLQKLNNFQRTSFWVYFGLETVLYLKTLVYFSLFSKTIVEE